MVFIVTKGINSLRKRALLRILLAFRGIGKPSERKAKNGLSICRRDLELLFGSIVSLEFDDTK